MIEWKAKGDEGDYVSTLTEDSTHLTHLVRRLVRFNVVSTSSHLYLSVPLIW